MPSQRKGDSFIDTVLAVWGRRKLVAVVIFLAVLAGGITVALSLPAIYRSTATVLVERQDMRDALVRPGLPSQPEARLHTIGQEIPSRARLETPMERFDPYLTPARPKPAPA